jgi:hypothetical protein
MVKFFLLFLPLFLFAVDYDCIVVGSSPTSLFEALYQACLGQRVLVVEQAAECGGSWKSISVCGVPHADMGCHTFGASLEVKQFLETYAGCTMVSEGSSFYPSHGCYELIHNLEQLLEKSGATLLLNSRLEAVRADEKNHIAEAAIEGQRVTASKIFVTSGADLGDGSKTPFFHLYLLLADPTPQRFTYLHHPVDSACRAMNMTKFVGLEGSGRQLIAFQVLNESALSSSADFLAQLKQKQLVAPQASILQTETYTYEQISNISAHVNQFPFEFIPARYFGQISQLFPKWKEALRPWKEVMACP